jgi:hypothetical protein
MPKEQNTVRVTAHEARPIDHIGISIDDGIEQGIVFIGIVLHVGVLDEQPITGRPGDASMNGGTLTLIDIMAKILDTGFRMKEDIFFDHPVSIVLGTVVDDKDLFLDAFDKRHASDLIEDGSDGSFLIIGRDDDGQFFGRRKGIN